jgi:hypothetical protein
VSEWARPASTGDDEPAPFEVFPTGATQRRDQKLTKHADANEVLRRSGGAVRDGYEHARDFRAHPGRRPGAVTRARRRQGGATDIVRPVLIDPFTACRLALSGELFAAPVEHLEIEHHGRDPELYLLWEARVTSDHGRGVPASLHLLASPSMVVTVLELVPRRRLRWASDRFVRDGVTAIEQLAHRLESCAA